MSLKRIWTIFKARNLEFYRDKGSLGWTFLFPLLVVMGFSFAFRFETDGLYKIAYVGNEHPQVELTQWIEFDGLEKAQAKLRVHKVDLVVDTRESPLRYWMSPTSPRSRITEKLFTGSFQQSASLQSSPLFQKNLVQGREIPYVEWLFPGLLSMNVMWMALWGVGFVIVRHRKTGILKRFKASPLTASEYLIAQLLSRLLVVVSSGVIVFAGAHLIYPFTTLGSYFEMLILYTLGATALSSMGLIIAARITSDELASGLINLFTFPMMFFSEIWFSLEGSGPWVKTFAQVFPLWHMTDGIRKMMTEGTHLSDHLQSVVILLLITLVFTVAGASLFKWTKD